MAVAPGVILDLGKLFQTTFGSKPYVVGKETDQQNDGTPYRITGTKSDQLTTANGSLIATQVKGVEIWFPVRFYLGNQPLQFLPFSVVKISGKKTIVKTPVMNRKGTVKEQYNVDDYSISLKGFLIGENGQFPEKEMDGLKQLFEMQQAVQIDNAITNIFLTDPGLSSYEQRRVVIESLDFPEVEGGRINVKPFSMQLESDFVFTLELE